MFAISPCLHIQIQMCAHEKGQYDLNSRNISSARVILRCRLVIGRGIEISYYFKILRQTPVMYETHKVIVSL